MILTHGPVRQDRILSTACWGTSDTSHLPFLTTPVVTLCQYALYYSRLEEKGWA